MNAFEQARPSAGIRIVVWSLGLGAAGVAPLLLYALLGPADGNPVGLGLLAVAAVPIAACGFVLGLIKLAIEVFVTDRR